MRHYPTAPPCTLTRHCTMADPTRHDQHDQACTDINPPFPLHPPCTPTRHCKAKLDHQGNIWPSIKAMFDHPRPNKGHQVRQCTAGHNHQNNTSPAPHCTPTRYGNMDDADERVPDSALFTEVHSDGLRPAQQLHAVHKRVGRHANFRKHTHSDGLRPAQQLHTTQKRWIIGTLEIRREPAVAATAHHMAHLIYGEGGQFSASRPHYWLQPSVSACVIKDAMGSKGATQWLPLFAASNRHRGERRGPMKRELQKTREGGWEPESLAEGHCSRQKREN
eukprot:1141707-Pelagomonas_calceolata.AAC.4